jgi:phosphatidylserine decarboxylase
MVRDGYFYALGMVVVAALLWLLTQSVPQTSLPVLLALFFLWFFGSRLRISVFLSVFDVHVNRAPVAGTVKAVEYREGQFLNAMNSLSAVVNEQTLVVLDAGTCEISYKQIAGLLARRIVCTVKVGDRVQRGQRVGMIKFGSRVDVLMPADAVPRVDRGSRVLGGSTILAVLPQPAINSANTTAEVAS